MVDMQTNQGLRTKSMSANDVLAWQKGSAFYGRAMDKPPSDKFLLLLPDTCPAYDLEGKRWLTLSVSRIRNVNWNDRLFNDLALQGSTKLYLLAMVGPSLSANKNGHVILFQGGAGTGKTFAAKAIAEHVKRPLYRIDVSDIGGSVIELEKSLRIAVSQGTRWGCVLLLEEADVDLEAGAPSEFSRNAMVVVLLSILDSLNGLLILTSNRLDYIGEAFRSRVHSTIHFPPPNELGRRKIWQIALEDSTTADMHMTSADLSEAIEDLPRYKMNGRQIRNTVQSARQLATFRSEQLRYSHLDEVIAVSELNVETEESSHSILLEQAYQAGG